MFRQAECGSQMAIFIKGRAFGLISTGHGYFKVLAALALRPAFTTALSASKLPEEQSRSWSSSAARA